MCFKCLHKGFNCSFIVLWTLNMRRLKLTAMLPIDGWKSRAANNQCFFIIDLSALHLLDQSFNHLGYKMSEKFEKITIQISQSPM